MNDVAAGVACCQDGSPTLEGVDAVTADVVRYGGDELRSLWIGVRDLAVDQLDDSDRALGVSTLGVLVVEDEDVVVVAGVVRTWSVSVVVR
ncbi:hypothetical protein ACLOJK_025991 [Asimina triloba]